LQNKADSASEFENLRNKYELSEKQSQKKDELVESKTNMIEKLMTQI